MCHDIICVGGATITCGELGCDCHTPTSDMILLCEAKLRNLRSVQKYFGFPPSLGKLIFMPNAVYALLKVEHCSYCNDPVRTVWAYGGLEIYVGHLESKERLRIQPAQLFNFS